MWRISVFDGVKLPWCICVAIETYLIRYFHCFRGGFFLHGLVSVVSLNWSNMHILNRLYHVYTNIHIYLLEKQYIPQLFNISKNKMMYKNMFSKQKILIACFSIIIKIREVFFFYDKTTALANDSIRTFKQKRLVCTCTVFFPVFWRLGNV